MSAFINALLAPSGLTPHGFCLAWQPGLIWLQAGSDILTAIAYYTIPAALLVVVRRRGDLAYPWIFALFAAFIMACGTTHVFGAMTLWLPLYWPEAIVKAATALLSVVTAGLLWPLIPKILALPSPAELQRINSQLAVSERRYRTLFTHAPAAMHSVGADRRVVEVSDAWLDLLGYTRAEVIGQPVARFHTPDSAARMHRDWDEACARPVTRDVERRFVCKSGVVLDVLLSASTEAAPDGQDGTRMICVITDITARKRAEAALRDSEERLRQTEKLTALGQLAGGIAHDFNNILQTVQGGSSLIRERAADPVAVRRLARMVEDASLRGSSVTRRLLVFARREALRAEPIGIPAMFEGLQEMLSHALGAGVQISLDLSPTLPEVLADRGQLETVLVNLATNARDAMPGGGDITLSAAVVTPAGPEYSQVELSVSDTGTGMDAATLARAEEPFFTTKPNGRGTGLGLAIARSFAEQSGGEMTIHSRPGQGTRVTLRLPAVVPATPPVQPPHHAAPASDGRRPKVLVVDDEAPVREIVAQQLGDSDCDVLLAENGAEALALLLTGVAVDVLITDLSMPGMDGVALIRAARQHRPSLPAILLTGYAAPLDADAAGGRFSLLHKPVTGPELAQHVRQALGVIA